MWNVTGTGMGTTTEYVYTVDAPGDADPQDVIDAACREHGTLLRAGTVPDFLDVRTLSANHR